VHLDSSMRESADDAPTADFWSNVRIADIYVSPCQAKSTRFLGALRRARCAV
jgi:hypothetical protein